MMWNRRPLALTGTLLIAASLAACAQYPAAPQPSYPGTYPGAYPGAYPAPAPQYPSQPAGTEFGRVSQIEVLQGTGGARTSGAGAVLGAVVGGILGNQIGGGTGRTAATAVGVLGGAAAGNAIEGRQGSGYASSYRLSIQLDHGGYRLYDVSHPGDLRVGDRVRLYNGEISRI